MLNSQTLAELRALGDQDPVFFKSLLGVFLESLQTRVLTVKATIDEKSGEKLAQAAHALKSSCYNLGAERLGELCAALEKLGRQGITEGASLLMQNLEKEVDAVRLEIAALPEMKTSA